MKVGILTFHRATNFGTVLQAYATVTALQELGYEAELIDYRPDYIENTIRTRRIKDSKNLKKILSIVINKIIYGNQMTLKNKNFLEFISEIPTSAHVYRTVEDVQQAAQQYDIILSGSDQLWNEKITGSDNTYFIPFEHKKKVSYASSFGVRTISEERKTKIREYLEDFKYISVREKTAEIIVKEILDGYNISDIKIERVIDPTLLVKKETWCQLLNNNLNLPKEGYILTYYMIETPILRKITKKLEKETGLPVVNIKPSKKQMVLHEGKNMMWAGPREYLRCYAGAKYVVTNSFHGSAFAVNFEVPMYVAPLPVSMAGEVNSRLVELLEWYNLSERWIDSDDAIENINYKDKLNGLKEIKEKHRSKSVEIINEMLGKI